MPQAEEENRKIEIKGYNWYRAGLLLDVICYIPIMWLLVMVCIELIRSLALLSIPFCGLTAFLTFLIFMLIRLVRNIVIRLEPVEGGFRATTISTETKQFHPDQVREIKEGYSHIVLVLEDGKKLDFAKTYRLSFSGHYTVWDEHIWTPFFTSQRFPNAIYKTLRFPR